jgi:hypothetical protein
MRTRTGSVDKYAICTSCGTFTIARMVAFGVDRYALWKGKELLGIHGSPDEARSAVSNTRTVTAYESR